MPSAAVRLIALCGVVSLTPGCSHLGSLGVGPVITRPSGVETSSGNELRLRQGSGSNEAESLSVIEAQARFAVAERASALAVGVGPAYLRWFGPVAFTVRGAPMLGGQYFDRTVFASAGLHGGLGCGLKIDETEQLAPRFGPIWAGIPPPKHETVSYLRQRTLLTLELTGAADAHARGATLSVGILLGLAWSEEYVTRPLLPW
jgi:hypothetical protein